MGTLQNFQKPLQKKQGESFEMSLRVSKKVERPERPGKSGNSRSVQKTLTSFTNDKESEVQQ